MEGETGEGAGFSADDLRGAERELQRMVAAEAAEASTTGGAGHDHDGDAAAAEDAYVREGEASPPAAGGSPRQRRAEKARTDLLLPLCLALALVLGLAFLVANPEFSQPSSYADRLPEAMRRGRHRHGPSDQGRRWFHEHAAHSDKHRRRVAGGAASGEHETYAQWTKARHAQQHLWNVRDLILYKHGRKGSVPKGLRSVVEQRIRAHHERKFPPPERRRGPRQYELPQHERVPLVNVRTVVKHPTPIVWYAPFWSGGGFSNEAISFVAGLMPHHVEFPLTIRQCGDSINDAFVAGMEPGMRDMLKGVFKAAPAPMYSVAICHIQPDHWYPFGMRIRDAVMCPDKGVARYRVGRVMFETDRFPARWLEALNQADELWVPTHFHKRTFAANGVIESKLVVIPEAVDVRRLDPAAVYPYPLPGYRASDYKFLSIFKWENRKGWRTLLEAFVREFTADDNVALYILTHPVGWSHRGPADDYRRIAAEFITDMGLPKGHKLPRIFFLKEDVPEEEMASVYKAADCFVLPTLGEGWGLPQVEAMAMGLPVITTFWSGPTEYLNERNGYPLRIDGLEEAKPDWPGHYWAKPSVSHLMELMRHVTLHENHAEAREKGRQARRDVVTKYCKQCVSEIVLKRLRYIAKNRLPEVHLPGTSAAEGLRQREEDIGALLDSANRNLRHEAAGLMAQLRRDRDPHDSEKVAAALAGAKGHGEAPPVFN